MSNPRLVIALAVYNGEKYLSQAIESILNQTFSDFKLLIGDNASTDATPVICQKYAQQDSRITYYRHPKNIGASSNHNFLFQPGDAPYFKWAAHDDVLKPDYLEKCIALLDQNPYLAIAHSLSVEIDANGKQLKTYDYELRLNGVLPRTRFWSILWTNYFNEVFGVMRTQLIKNTNLYGSYVGADRNFTAEMVLQGDVGYVDEYLFLRRHHPQAFTAELLDDASRLKWFDPEAKTPTFLTSVVKFQKYFDSIFQLPLPLSEKIACFKLLLDWAMRRGIRLPFTKDNQFQDKLISKHS
ncbi:glycosyl transferase family 2 [Stanieria cyanosphaera PCC 7437]|uniref:Glycosyl transferase family 2 n=1 Tax=Stanieria cyanosphaera (strain ATCC 29371 / PCC 7437) TaxID=111780 RepID=K9XR58_STAC7|nr:glycosyltransferase [Stanieria cyanosphaera]AFZ34147.1 glycosyl transferase family 2 [Stanieria cyanosphaera PCC 7437]